MPNFDRAQDLLNHIALNAGIFVSASAYERNLESFQRNARENNAFCNVSPDRTPDDLGAKGFVKRCIRKCVGWYIRPAFREQSMFNASVTRSINDLEPTIVHLSTEIEKIAAMVEKLQSNQEALSNRLAALGGKTISTPNKPDDQSHKEPEQ